MAFFPATRTVLHCIPPGTADFLAFGFKQLRACVFAGTFFLLLALSNLLPSGVMPRYDFLLLSALVMQFALVYWRWESWDELKVISLFHLIGLMLELFKTHPGIASWSYPETAYSKILGVPLYAGFMYAAVASYMVQAWRLFDLRLRDYPPYWQSLPLAGLVYLNFFTHHFIGDFRWLLIVLLLWVFRRSAVSFTPLRRRYRMRLSLSFALIGLFIWVAENLATGLGAWVYPHQQSAWSLVSIGKVSSWSLLVVITLILIADLKQIKERRLRTLPPYAETFEARAGRLSRHLAERLRARAD